MLRAYGFTCAECRFAIERTDSTETGWKHVLAWIDRTNSHPARPIGHDQKED